MSFRPFTVGQEVGIAKLRKMYDNYVIAVLCNSLEEQPRERRQQRRYKVTQDLPTLDEYHRLKSSKYETSVESLMDDAYSEIEALSEEMRERFDNMPENLQGGDVGTRCEEAADALEYLDRTDYPSDQEITVVFYPSLGCDSRPARAAEAASRLTHAADALREWAQEIEDDEDEEVDTSFAEELADTLEEHAGELESVDFPGMYG